MRLREQLGGFRQRVRSTRTGRLTLQLLIGVLGLIVVAVGIVLIPFPGPGWIIVLAGLAVWALEFAWAERLLHFVRSKLQAWWHWLGRQRLAVRGLAGLVGLVAIGAVVVLALRYTFHVDLVDLVLP